MLSLWRTIALLGRVYPSVTKGSQKRFGVETSPASSDPAWEARESTSHLPSHAQIHCTHLPMKRAPPSQPGRGTNLGKGRMLLKEALSPLSGFIFAPELDQSVGSSGGGGLQNPL